MPTILLTTFQNFKMFQYRSDSPQVKRYLISSIANLVDHVPDVLDLGSRKLGNIRKISNLGGRIVQCLVSFQELTLYKQQLKNTQKHIPNFYFPVHFYWTLHFVPNHFVQDCLSKQIFGPNSAQSPSNPNFLTFFITPKHFYELQ